MTVPSSKWISAGMLKIDYPVTTIRRVTIRRKIYGLKNDGKRTKLGDAVA